MSGAGDGQRADLLTDIATLPGAFVATLLAIRVGRASGDSGTRRAWTLAAAAFATYLCGTVLDLGGFALGMDSPLTAVSGIIRLGWIPLTAWALAVLPRDTQTRPGLVLFLLDLAIVAWSTAMVLWHFVLYPAAVRSGTDLGTVVLSAAYPAGDLCIAFAVAAVALRRVRRTNRTAVLIMVPGLALAFAADMLTSVHSIEGSSAPGALVGLLRASTWLAFCVAALVQSRMVGDETGSGAPAAFRPFAWLPYAAIAAGFFAPAVRSWGDPDMLRQHVPATGILIALVLVRLAVTSRQHIGVATAERGRLAAAVEQAAESITMTDSTGRITYVNPAFTQVTGYGAMEVVGEDFRSLGVGSPDPGHEVEVAAVLARGDVWSGLLSGRRRDGTPVELDSVISPLRDNSGAIVGIVSIGRDVSRERALEAQLGQAQRLEAVGRLAGGIAHDFNNILTAIRGFGELAVAESAPDGPLVDDLGEILKAADRAAILTRQLLAFGGKQLMQRQVLDLNEVVRDVVPMLRRLVGEDIDLVTICGPSLGNTLADRAQLEQVIVNLVVNARDAMPGGGRLTIETVNADLAVDYPRAHPGGEPGPHVTLTVSDTGSGMPADVLEHAFEPFFTTKAAGKGTGLGLSTVFGIVQQSNGWVHAYSEPGHGTTIRVYLPRIDAAAERRTAERQGGGIPAGTETILVVEDEAAVRLFAERVLSRAGYRVLVAESGAAALAVAADAGHIDVLFSDIVMPGMSGPELAERLAAARPEMRVVYASGYSGEAIVHRGMLDRQMVYLAKPYTTEKLLRLLRAVLDETAVTSLAGGPKRQA